MDGRLDLVDLLLAAHPPPTLADLETLLFHTAHRARDQQSIDRLVAMGARSRTRRDPCRPILSAAAGSGTVRQHAHRVLHSTLADSARPILSAAAGSGAVRQHAHRVLHSTLADSARPILSAAAGSCATTPSWRSVLSWPARTSTPTTISPCDWRAGPDLARRLACWTGRVAVVERLLRAGAHTSMRATTARFGRRAAVATWPWSMCCWPPRAPWRVPQPEPVPARGQQCGPAGRRGAAGGRWRRRARFPGSGIQEAALVAAARAGHLPVVAFFAGGPAFTFSPMPPLVARSPWCSDCWTQGASSTTLAWRVPWRCTASRSWRCCCAPVRGRPTRTW